MVSRGLFVRLEAKPGQEAALEAFLKQALSLARSEVGTPVWYAVRFDHVTFAIFDAFANENDLAAHLDGPIAAGLMAHADELLASPPNIERWELLASK